jgi:iron complex transport system substrate-binding protein
MERILITGEVFGGEAQEEAIRFVEYFQQNIKRVEQVISNIPKSERVRVWGVRSDPFRASGKGNMNHDWITKGGGINVAAEDSNSSGRSWKVSLEQIITYNPEVIICGKKSKEIIINDERWQEIQAVKEQKIYVIPWGVFEWGAYGAEEALQVLWVAKTLYPEHFADLDIEQETRGYYKEFFEYDLSDEELQGILYPELASWE